MTGRDCDIIRDLLPSVEAGSLPLEEETRVREHLQACPVCREELEVVRSVLAARPDVPSGLEGRIQARLREEGAGSREGLSESPMGLPREASGKGSRDPFAFRRSRWGLSAAAVFVVALGVGVIWSQREPAAVEDSVEVASQESLPEAWLWDDGIVAGAPVLDALSDEDLEALLEEYEG